MPDVASPLPCRRTELIVRPLGEEGRYVVKDPKNGGYFQIGDEEHFLLTQLDGRADAATVRSAYAERFAAPLGDDDLDAFLVEAEAQGFLEPVAPAILSDSAGSNVDSRAIAPPNAPMAIVSMPLGMRLLFWRKSLFDPDRLFTWLAPKIALFWTRTFLCLSSICIASAAALVWIHRQELAATLQSLHWQTGVLAWLAMMAVLTCHEFAHGLTCKRYGGEVHEVGFVMIFFMPCFYCNVSDAWLFREKWKRLLVTFAGGYFELFLWALAVFVWRLTTPDTVVHYLAFVVLSACGVQTLFNWNPLLKLDGYYLLSDWLEIPNLQQRAAEFRMAWIRSWLWGAARPEREPHWRAFLLYGVVSWLYSLIFLSAMLIVLGHFAGTRWGIIGFLLVGLLALMSARGIFHGFTAGEVQAMLLSRHKRTAIWALLLVGVPSTLFCVPMVDRAGGTFRVRPTARVEIRAGVAGFLKSIDCDEGDAVSPRQSLGLLEAPDLISRIAQKRAEISEAEAKLKVLQAGVRPEEISEQRQRTVRAMNWRDLATKDLERMQRVFAEELNRLEKQIDVAQAELDVAIDAYERAKKLASRGAQTEEQLREAEGRRRVAEAKLAEARATSRAGQAKGTLEAETELARREKAVADEQAALRLMEAGSRHEEIGAQQARLDRLHEELRHLEQTRDRQAVLSPIAGRIVTAHLKEKVGQFLHEGDLICTVEDQNLWEAEITLVEHDVAAIRVGQPVELKFRTLPHQSVASRVDRIAAAAGRAEAQSTLAVYCRIPSSDVPTSLRSDMSGFARVYTEHRSVGEVLYDRSLRFLRTEFWW